jgi:ABC-type uncharacterized transport system involved in gliding motility auxiliary subunit
VEVDYLDPADAPERAQSALRRLGIDPKSVEDADLVVFESPREAPAVPRTRMVPFGAIVEVDYTFGGDGRVKAFKQEDLFTEAILDVTRDKPTAVYLLAGHEELTPHAGGPAERISLLETVLKTLGYSVESFEFQFAGEGKRTEVPADCDVLVLAGPQGRFDDREIGALRAYLERGGRALLLGEPVVRRRAGSRGSGFFDDTRINELLKGYGLSLEGAYVFDESSMSRRGNPLHFLPKVQGISESHPITKPLLGARLPFAVAQPVVILPPGEAPPEVKTQAILETAPSAIAYKDPDATDPYQGTPRKGPITLAAVARKPVTATATVTGTAVPAEARLVVVGDVQIATDAIFQDSRAADFVLNAIAWLAEREETIAIGSKPPEIIRLKLDDDQRKRLRLVSLVELPLLCAIIALAVFWVRRS